MIAIHLRAAGKVVVRSIDDRLQLEEACRARRPVEVHADVVDQQDLAALAHDDERFAGRHRAASPSRSGVIV